MEQQIINFIKSKNNIYIDINDKISIEKIYNLLINDIIYEPINSLENHYLGWYYDKIRENEDLMEKYYLVAIDDDNIYSITNLGSYYKNKNKNYDLMKKYYLMGIDKGHHGSMHHLAQYYQDIEKNYDLAKKYYLMAIDKENTASMNNLGHYYRTTEKNYDLAKKYYLMAIDKGNFDSMNNLGHYYQDIEKNYDLMEKYYLMAIDKDSHIAMANFAYYYQYVEKNYDLMEKYYLMGIDRGNTTSFDNLINYYHNNNLLISKLELFIKYTDKIERKKIINNINEIAKIKLIKEDKQKFLDIIINFEFEEEDNLSSTVDMLIESIKYKLSKAKLHFEYSLGGKGFEDAKNDFYNKIT
jgi:TPR repeat protein